MKATTLLEHQHRQLQELCETVERGSASMRASLLPQLASDLAAHIAVEEEVFYPAACAALHDDGWLGACRSKKHEVRQSLHRALGAAPDGEEFAHAISQLRRLVDGHAQEEDVLFPRLEKALDARAMRDLGVSMLALYDLQVEASYKDD
jgi:hemerythrin-like domain-containing protein